MATKTASKSSASNGKQATKSSASNKASAMSNGKAYANGKAASANGKSAAAKKTSQSTSTKSTGQQSASSSLEKFFIDGLKDIYWAEKALTKALPKMQKAATSDELKTAFGEHLEQTREHVSRLEQVFEAMGKKAQAKKCDAMEGLIKEGQEIIEETEKGTMTRDVALIMAAQKVEHYEIASYGGLAQLAKTMGLTDAKELLGTTLQEEKDTDSLLTDIAENCVNADAMEEA